MPAPRPPSRPSRPAARSESAVLDPVNDAQRDALQDGLEHLPTPLEPLDVSALDGYLCGVLLQPQALPESRWLPHVFDVEGRPLPAGLDVADLRTLVLRRHRELVQAVAARQWFDPWVFELEDDDDDDEVEAVYPWVAGFATALTLFPALSDLAAGPQASALVEPLALIYRHLDPDDLEDAEELLAEIDTLEPPANLSDAVEGLVRATLLMADVTQPQPKPAGGSRSAPGRPRPSSRGPRTARR